MTVGQRAIGKRVALGVVVVLLIVALILLELLVKSFREAFGDHVITASFVTSILVIGLTALVIDQIGRTREYRRTEAPALEAIEQLASAALDEGRRVAKAYLGASDALSAVLMAELADKLGRRRPGEPHAKREALVKKVSRLRTTVRAARAAVGRAAARCQFVAFRDDVATVLAYQRAAELRLDELQSGLNKVLSLASQPYSVVSRDWDRIALPLLLGVDPILEIARVGKAARNTAFEREIEVIERRLTRLNRGANHDPRTRNRDIRMLEATREAEKALNQVANAIHDDHVEELDDLLRFQLEADLE